MERTFALIARSRRGEFTESWHHGLAAVCAPSGALVARLGDPTAKAFLRSAAKPMQAVAMLRAGLSREEVSDAELALACASHAGRDRHVQGVSGLLAGGDLTAAALLCGPHEPFDAEAAGRLRARGEAPSALHNNCSGKHAAMLRTCRRVGWSLGDYVAADHPLQRAIEATLDRFCRTGGGSLGSARDGCGVPTYRAPLVATATAYAAFADPRVLSEPEDVTAAERVFGAMTGHADLVAGPGRFTTRLMEVAAGRLLAKEGADGFYAVAVRGATPLGIAVKVADGSDACRPPVVLDILRQLDVLDEVELEALAEFRRLPRTDCRGREIGELVGAVELDWEER